MLEEFEDTKGVIKIFKLKKNRQHNGQKEKGQKDKQRSTKHTHKTKDRVTRSSLKTGGELRCSERVSSSYSTSDTRRYFVLDVYSRRTHYPESESTTLCFYSCMLYVLRGEAATASFIVLVFGLARLTWYETTLFLHSEEPLTSTP